MAKQRNFLERLREKGLDPILELVIDRACGRLLVGILEFLGRISLGILPSLSKFLEGISDARFRLARFPSFCS